MLWHEHNLTNVFSLFKISMGRAGLIKGKCFVDVRPNPTFLETIDDHFHPFGDLLGLVPHVTKIQTEDASVAVHQSEGMKKRRLEGDLGQSKFPFQASRRGG